MNNILQILKNNTGVKALINKEEGLASLTTIEEALLLIAYFKQTKKNIIVVKNNAYNAQRLFEYIVNINNDDKILLFNVEESLRIEAIAASPETMADKIETLSKLMEDQQHLLITNTAGLLKHLPNCEHFTNSVIKVKINQEITIDELSKKLIRSGYQMTARVDQPLTFARRGGIIDVFSINYDSPIRIEFFDTTIDSLRYFDISSQRTIALINEVNIMPATDILFTQQQITEIIQNVQIQLEKERANVNKR